MRKLVLTTITFFILISAVIGQNHKPDLDLKLGNGIELKASPAYPDEDISTFDHLKIVQNGKIIFKDTTLTEYTIKDSLYPKLYDFKNHLELLIEIDDRPSKNKIFKFKIKNNLLEKIDTLPTFIAIPKDLDQDNKLEYAGFWDYGEVWGDSIQVTDYNPIVFYEINEMGINLDSITTIRVNTTIYGKFYGFFFHKQIEIPFNEDGMFSMKIDEILNE